MNRKILITFLFLVFASFAEDKMTFGEPTLVQDNGSAITSSFSTREDSAIFSVTGGTNLSTTDLAAVQDVEVLFVKRFGDSWIGATVSSSTGDFLNFTDNHSTTSTNTNAEVYFQRGEGDTLTNLFIGATFMYRFNFVYSIWGDSRWFEHLYVSAGMMRSEDSMRSLNYVGYGLKSSYKLMRRLGKRFSLGLDFSWQIAPVKRSAITEGESSNERSFTLQWATVGAVLQFTF